ncbi:hypothetical protein CO057_04705 [Candidatus Uhrbacteria bacterium CG_4_9_14_0_2_um_filter_41_50]|uniref:Transcription regulator TrmB N-terminal domain-containing protein n=1 Tax=Candidatus Uhrbacteria bacterium CG_4_9_14_0_2_um_filter_41_50 TaxID=1975031 RepID=A0A2M8EMX7_9BACT|nr:MAG: hypothetical protein COZ45_01480 [Candidatus Uhrbacteria bacterium CG_4_10_14_3_um_filter_41_21]PIZ55260.1 MAG: hypothetical protein COY24_01030 [Candidatus Uhrbacteria bacterium CG_4_10_14_0_2_um_filter_41_21]PJB84279.1 MAG: hypothetical protein CO086_04495 [Candidatus Uhrbacteria bacterium CG_4_9_14_0_8_um_filter_41_16]PJC24094.1 MAG: hypothetical protein CO057_04705 [Candidatus Uhrbacteria bacterium CG_4_9_14_0_2_um_filter_41_50]
MKSLKLGLESLQLSDNARQLYMLSFEVGRSTIGKLASALSMDRSSAYLAVEQLKDAGLMKEDVTDGVKRVIASPPDIVERLLKKRAEAFIGFAEEIHKDEGELLASYQAKDRRVVLESFSGRKSLRRITQDILLSSDKEVRIFTNQNAERKVFSASEHDNFILERVRKGIKAYVLASDTSGAKLLQKYDRRELRQTKIVKELKPIKNETYIYADKVAVLGFSDTIFGFIVQDKEFAQLQKILFDRFFSS